MKKWPWSMRDGAEMSSKPAAHETLTSIPQQTSIRAFRSGVKSLHDGENSVLDIIFVHGLTGDREETWKANGASTPWPATLLPSKVDNARILTFGYDSYVADWRGMVSKNRIGNHSMNLLTAIATHREDDDTNDRPIIFVCHSLGGLVCEDALSTAQQRPERHLRQILHCTRGIIFLGTPHHGSGLAHWAESLAKTIGLIKQTNPEILNVLRSESEVLERVQGSFHTMIRSRAQEGLPPIEITCFYEELPLPGVGIVVPSHSAILPGYIPIGIRDNHMDMTRFNNSSDPGFIAVAGELRRWSKSVAQSKGSTSASTGLQPETLSANTLSSQLNPVRLDSQGKLPEQSATGGSYNGIQISSIPFEFAQHLPQSTMGLNERNLLKAAGKGDLQEAQRLIKDGANLSAINEDGESALTRAISRKHNAIAKLLLENGATTDYNGPLVQKPLHIAVQTGNIKMAELLLDHGADVDELTGHGSVLGLAVTAGREDLAALLMSRDADPNNFRFPIHSPLGSAIRQKKERLIKDLLKHGAGTDVLLEHLYVVTAKLLPQPCQALLRDWRAQGYEEQVRIIRDRSSEPAEKEDALNQALKCASTHRQQEIYAMFLELKEEFGLARSKEYVYRS